MSRGLGLPHPDPVRGIGNSARVVWFWFVMQCKSKRCAFVLLLACGIPVSYVLFYLYLRTSHTYDAGQIGDWDGGVGSLYIHIHYDMRPGNESFESGGLDRALKWIFRPAVAVDEELTGASINHLSWDAFGNLDGLGVRSDE